MEPIKGFEDYMIDRDGNILGKRFKRLLKPAKDGTGYLLVVLMKDKKRISCKIHRLLASQFIENPNNLPFVDHIDRNKLNNNLENLRWVTYSQNSRNIDCKGYCWNKQSQKYQVQYALNKKAHYIGLFETEQEAREAYLNAIKDLF
jgi:hypothetical protein